jgi:phage tail-like protein
VSPAIVDDVTGPRVVGAQARELARVRVSFDRPVKQADAAASDDALNPARYVLTRASAPAVDVSVVAVEPVTSSAVDLLTDIPLTPAAVYRLEASGLVDVSGNVLAAPDNAAAFTGFIPPRSASRVFDLYRFLPEMNRREDVTGDLQRFIACLQEVTDLILHDVDRFTDIVDPDIASDPFLDLMLPELGNPFPVDLSAVDKRRLLNVLVAMYREKGTERGIINAIRFFLQLEVTITAYTAEALILGESLLGVDWVLGPSTAFAAYGFAVVVPQILDAEGHRRLQQIVDYMKPAHTHARIVEPVVPEVIEHVELGISELDATWELHG